MLPNTAIYVINYRKAISAKKSRVTNRIGNTSVDELQVLLHLKLRLLNHWIRNHWQDDCRPHGLFSVLVVCYYFFLSEDQNATCYISFLVFHFTIMCILADWSLPFLSCKYNIQKILLHQCSFQNSNSMDTNILFCYS